MIRLAISVEGLTEERFANKLLAPYLETLQIYTVPLLLGRNGGDVSLPRVKKDLNRLASSFDKVTTLYDFYGFRDKSVGETKQTLEQKILESVAEPLRGKIFPYVQMYEFEGILFSSPEAIENVIQENGIENWAQGVLDNFDGDPEEINDSRQTAPSKRLSKKTGYIKTVHGPDIAEEIGLEVLRQTCTGFGAWLDQLEKLS